jgi:hypothetical protein
MSNASLSRYTEMPTGAFTLGRPSTPDNLGRRLASVRIADVPIDDAKEADNRLLVGGDAVEIAHAAMISSTQIRQLSNDQSQPGHIQ